MDALATVGLNLSLKVGSSAEQVTVSDTPPVLNTEDARLGETMRHDVYTNLPLAMGVGGIGAGPRNPGAFIYLMPFAFGIIGTAGKAQRTRRRSCRVFEIGCFPDRFLCNSLTGRVTDGSQAGSACGLVRLK